MNEDIIEAKICRREIITDQSDPRMLEFRRKRGEFEPGCKQKTVKLELTEYEPGPNRFKVTTEIGYYGEPPPAFRKFFREFYKRVLNKKIEEKKFRKV